MMNIIIILCIGFVMTNRNFFMIETKDNKTIKAPKNNGQDYQNQEPATTTVYPFLYTPIADGASCQLNRTGYSREQSDNLSYIVHGFLSTRNFDLDLSIRVCIF